MDIVQRLRHAAMISKRVEDEAADEIFRLRKQVLELAETLECALADDLLEYHSKEWIDRARSDVAKAKISNTNVTGLAPEERNRNGNAD